MARKAWLGGLLALAGLVSTQGTYAQTLPPGLEGWQSWVLDGESARACTLRAGRSGQAVDDFSCVAVGTMDLAPEGEGISFEVRVRADEEVLVNLPGQEGRWPQDVRVDNQSATLRWNNTQWQVVIPKGEHTLRGQWVAGFEQVAMPALFAQVRWAPEQRMLRHENGQAWVRTREVIPSDAPAVDSIPAQPHMRVWRALQDGQAMTLDTRIELRLSGGVEQLDLGQALPEGFQVTGWHGSVPAVVTPQGRLLVQAGRGQHQVRILARCDQACLPQADGSLPTLKARANDAPWPTQETWSVLNAPDFRHITAEGVGVDPGLAQVPGEWQQAGAYTVNAQQGIALRVVARGRVSGEGEQLELTRESWWRGDHWAHWDHLTGTLPVGGRLSLDPPYTLGRMERHGHVLPLSIDGTQRVGVEWSQGQVDVFAQSTHPLGQGARTGWNGVIEQMTQSVHLPPGARLLAAPGANPGHGAWTDQFTLLTFFGIALLALLVRQAMGWKTAVVAGVLAAGWVGHGGALGVLWLMAIAATLLLVGQALPAGRLVDVVRALALGAMGLLVLFFIPFAGEQARQVLHPQLEQSHYNQSSHLFEDAAMPTASTSQDFGHVVMEQEAAKRADAQDMLSRSAGAVPPPAPMAVRAPAVLEGPDLSNAVDANDPLAGIGLAQVGQALPSWQQLGLGRTYHLTYPGPIGSDEGNVSQPLVAGPWIVRIVRLLGTLGLAWLALKLLGQVIPTTWQARLPGPARAWATRLGVALLLVPTLGLASTPAVDPVTGLPSNAQNMPRDARNAPVDVEAPQADLLAQLRERLTRAPVCAPHCASLVDAQLDARDDQLVATYRVDAQHATGWTLPGMVGAELVEVTVNGAGAWWMERGVVRLVPGQARVVARYRPHADQVRVNFTQASLSSHVVAQGWNEEGTQDRGSWVLARAVRQAAVQETPKNALPAGADIPGYVDVTRHLNFGGTVDATTVVSRVGDYAGALTVRVPAMTGEAVEHEQVQRQGEHWEVVLPAGQARVRWTSRITLPSDGAVKLSPLPAQSGTETWRLTKSPAWTLSLEGVPENLPVGGVRTVLPLAGETLTVRAARLPAAPGEAQRIDSVTLVTQAGAKLAKSTLTFNVFAAQAGERRVTLPAESEVISIRANDQVLSLPMTQQGVTIPVARGNTQVAIEFRGPTGQAWLTSPQVDLDGQAHNVRTQLSHEKGRWVLATFGPGWGTAVLYWSQLLVLLAVAWGLSRLPGQLFTLPVAVLLVLGFSTLPGTVIWLGALVAWVAMVAWRARHTPDTLERNTFNLAQLALAGFTGVTVLAVIVVIGYGLLGARPDMMLRAPAGLGVLEWWRDLAPSGPLNGPTVISAPLWVYQVLLFAWALWFAAWLVAAVKRALLAWTHGGYWNSRTAPTPPQPPVLPKEPNTGG